MHNLVPCRAAALHYWPRRAVPVENFWMFISLFKRVIKSNPVPKMALHSDLREGSGFFKVPSLQSVWLISSAHPSSAQPCSAQLSSSQHSSDQISLPQARSDQFTPAYAKNGDFNGLSISMDGDFNGSPKLFYRQFLKKIQNSCAISFILKTKNFNFFRSKNDRQKIWIFSQKILWEGVKHILSMTW